VPKKSVIDKEKILIQVEGWSTAACQLSQKKRQKVKKERKEMNGENEGTYARQTLALLSTSEGVINEKTKINVSRCKQSEKTEE
jgi:hypothetical protein